MCSSDLYLLIEETRFVDRLHVHYDVDESALSARIAPLTLQPLVENSIKHGIKDQEGGAEITICVRRDKENVNISVADNGKGIEPMRLRNLGEQSVTSERGTGVGLYNVNKRLEYMHG